MKKIHYTALSFLAAAAILLPTSCFAAADVCGEGVGIPPFLSSGAKPNLLMVLDNSGSMLDAAYSEKDAFCFDDSYTSSTTYGGYFQNEKWYKWIGSPYPAWKNRTAYTTGTRVYVNGIIWEALTGSTSTGTSIADDIGVAWKKIYSVPKWKNKTAYSTNDFVWSGPQLYKAKNSGTSNDADSSNGLNLADDTGVTWEAVDSTWLKGKNYAAKSIVSYKGILYETESGGTSNGTGVYDDKGVTWKRLDEGYFAETTQSEAATHCSTAAGASADKHTHADLCVSLNRNVTPNQVSAFAAKGNLLNWAMSSKFDVEKKILTGGKHNYYDQFLISEHRGCSGSRTIKQISLTDGKFLSLGMRGSKHSDAPAYEDRLDSTDDTGRLEVLAVTATGYQMSAACKAAIDKIIEPPPTGGLNGAQNAISQCIASWPNATSKAADTRPTLNNSLQACWQDDPKTATFEITNGIFNNLVNDCLTLYTGVKQPGSNFTPSRAYKPSELRPADGGPYLCYGLYDSGIDDENRVGYMGRCWIPGGGGTVMKYCDPRQAAGECSGGFPCYWKYDNKGKPVNQGTSVIDSVDYRNTADGLVYKCTNKAQTPGTKNNDPYICTNWGQQMGKWSDGSGDCYYPSAPVSIGGNSNGVWEVSTWPNDMNVPAWPDNGILKAIADYCGALKVPEVIDPSSSAGISGDTGNAPGLLRDSELMAFLGGKDPMSTMKGRIQQVKRPEGVIQKVKQDIRVSAMSFNYVGAKAECDQTANTPSKLEKYCPLNNRDGAQLLTYNSQPLTLEVGDFVKANDSTYESGKRYHADELAEAINTVRATSWTPLAEALYSAIGYYTQNDKFCLTKDSNGNCLDFKLTPDPVQYWCQDNHIVLITEGESTADVNATVAAFADEPSTHFVNKEAGDDVSGGTDNNPQQCGGGLYGSGYLDDMTWWGQHVTPLYQTRKVKDSDGNEIDKQNIYTHVVTTGTLTSGGAGECNPVTLMTNTAVNGGTNAYYPGENPQKLEDNLYAVLDDILSRSSSGSAASVISSSRSGAGAVYQAVFWPKYEDIQGNKVSWIGDVHSLFVGSTGLMYEDSNQDGKLEPGPDKRIIFYFSSKVNKTRGCYTTLKDGQCPNDEKWVEQPCPGTTECVEIQDIKYIWSANKELRDDKFVVNKRKIFTWNDADNDGIVDAKEWFNLSDMTTGDKWDDLNKSAANSGTRGPVTKDFLSSDDWSNLVKKDPAKTDYPDKTDAQELDALNALIGWIQGIDQLDEEITDDNGNQRLDKPLRSRQFALMENGSDEPVTKEWRLGDIIHSTPMAVAAPAESYHSLYRDPTYAAFYAQWAHRRTMIYFGGNDGMLHAVNGGFYAEKENLFCCEPLNADGTCGTKKDPNTRRCPDNSKQLGEEMWAYVPYNLQPHLKCLTSRFYAHKYFVDQRPRIFDAQIFNADEDHPHGWGTILVGSMRFGGAPIKASELNGLDGTGGKIHDQREFSSSFFILDITNPEKEPKPVLLLGELTRTTELNGSEDKYVDLNYTTSSPSMIIMRTEAKDPSTGNPYTKWYLVMGNGPAELNGTNTNPPDKPSKQALLAILPLEWLQQSQKEFRLLNKIPDSDNQGGRFLVPYALDPSGNSTPGYISDIVSVDYNIETTASDDKGSRYKTDAVYFGTVDGSGFTKYTDNHPDYLLDILSESDRKEQFYWNGGGRLFRLVTKVGDINSQGEFKEKLNGSLPSEWPSPWKNALPDSMGPVRLLADLQMPVTAGPSIGYDGNNYWIYAGTGRFLSDEDKTNDGRCLQSNTTDPACNDRSKIGFFGIKEPLKDAHPFSSFADWVDTTNGDKVTCKKTYPVMTWGRIDWDTHKQDNSDLNPTTTTPKKVGAESGKRGLMQTDNILVAVGSGYLDCSDPCSNYVDCYKTCSNYACDVIDCSSAPGTTVGCGTCFPTSNGTNQLASLKELVTDTDKEEYTFSKLRDYIAGTGCQDVNGDGKLYTTGLDGWYREFHDPRERNLGTATLLGGLLTYTAYQPFNDKCKAEGQSTLYGIHYQTGTAGKESVFGTFNRSGGTYVMDNISLGRGLATTPSITSGSPKQLDTRDTDGDGILNYKDDDDDGDGIKDDQDDDDDGDGTKDEEDPEYIESYDAKAFIQTSTGEIIEITQKNLPVPPKRRIGRMGWTDRCAPEE